RQLSSAGCNTVPSGGIAVLASVGILYAFIGLAVVCDEFFQTSLEKISDVLELTPDVAGATFLAAGSSAPELLTSTMDAFGDANSVGMGTIVGSAMFNILVIVALSAAVAGKGGGSLMIDWRPVCRDVFFYSYSIGILSIAFMDSTVKIYESTIMVISYMGYILFAKFNKSILSRCEPPKIEPSSDDDVAGVAGMAEDVVSRTKTETITTVSAIEAGPMSIGDSLSDENIATTTSSKVVPLPTADEDINHSREEESKENDECIDQPERRKSMTLGVRHRVERNRSGPVGSETYTDSQSLTKKTEEKRLVGSDQNQAVAEEGLFTNKQIKTVSSDDKEGEGKPLENGEEEESRFAWPDSIPDQV
ncbi:unnamed protein product, partial [Choristocarpus tenellus]